MLVFLGSEWGHNLAHAAVAGMLGKPADGIRIQLGLPRLIYKNLDDPTVTPREHILRALGGPLFNALLLPLAILIRRRTSPGSAARHVADIAVGTNTFLSTGSLLPIPGIDGGPILKWALVEGGRPIPEADEVVRKVNGLLAGGLGAAAVVAHRRRRRLLGMLAGLFAAIAFGVASGVIKE
jgi:Zn-dependent protease